MAFMITVLFIPTVSYAADEADDIKYTIDEDEELDFDEDKFDDVCEDLTGESLDYVQFDLPSKSKGILYYDYDGDDEYKIDDSDEFGDNGDDGSIDDITFVPANGYSGTVTISYTGYYNDGDDDFTRRN